MAFMHLWSPQGVLSFAVRSSIDFLPTLSNLKCWGKRSNVKCPLCKNKETLLHVLNNCTVSLNQGRYTWRHDSVLNHIVHKLQEACKNTNLKVYADIEGMTTSGSTIPANLVPTSQRPDIFVFDSSSSKAMIAELTVPFEQNINKSHDFKQNKYASLLADLNDRGINTSLVCFEVGSRGLVTKENSSRIRTLFKFAQCTFSKSTIKDISKISLLCSYGVWNSRHEQVWDNTTVLKLGI